MSDFALLKSQAEAIGLEGSEVGQWILQQQKYEREERQREREERQAEREAQERQAEREKEIRLAELQARGKPQVSVPPDSVTKPKLPVYADNEDIATYLVRFERVAELLELDKDSYAVRLGCLLTGKAAELYISLPSETTKDYGELKKALLTGFSKTPDGYRIDFRSTKIKVGQNYHQFATQLTRHFQSWIESSKVLENYDDLKEFMVLDQFLSSLTPELRLFVKERRTTKLQDAVQLADDWASAHNAYPKTRDNTRTGGRHAPSVAFAQKTPASSSEKRPSAVTCHNCGEEGHIRPRCPKNPRAFKDRPSSTSQYPQYKVGFCMTDRCVPNFSATGTINGSWSSSIIRDTGCSGVVISEEALPDVDPSLCPKACVSDYLGRIDEFPVVRCYLRCPFYTGWTDAIRAPIKFASALIGNIPGARNPNDLYPQQSDDHQRSASLMAGIPAPQDPSLRVATTETPTVHPALEPDNSSSPPSASESMTTPTTYVCAVQTRARQLKRVHPLVLPALQPLSVTPQEFSRLQSSCPSLEGIRIKAASDEEEKTRSGCTYRFLQKDGLLYRKCLSSVFPHKEGKLSLVVPRECRPVILRVAHEGPMAGHFSHRKTLIKIAQDFYWPSMGADIRDYCRSCDVCQRMSAKGRVRPVPLQPLPVVTEPFSRVSIDLVGPLSPPSSDGHRYILTLIDFATGFPEAMPLREIDTVTVSEALLTMFSRVGIPREILSDRGTQFTSQLMNELHRLLGVKPIFTTPFHPSGNGRIERFHGTLKSALRKLCSDKPRKWHRYLVPTLFALREIPNDRTGFSPFELLYGRSVRGPLSVLRDLWEDRSIPDDERTTFRYVLELREKLAECAQLASQQADVSIARYKSYFDVRSQDRQFKPGDEVLVLLPSNSSKLLVAWKGPFKVLERRGKVDYLIDETRGPKLYHANILKKYHRRARVNQVQVLDEISTLEETETAGKAPDLEEDPDLPRISLLADEPPTSGPDINPSLTWKQSADIEDLIMAYPDVFSYKPGCTNTLEHDIILTTTERIQAKIYPVPIHLQSHYQEEVDQLLSQGIIQPSSSPHCSPVVMVRKADDTYRMAIDYRLLNSVTIFHAEPACNIEEELHKFSDAIFFSELDLCKAYYQVPLSTNARQLTAFPTHKGLMEFTRMPFGLVTACATYIRLMRIVLASLPNVSFYFDNIFIYSSDWLSHVSTIKSVLERLRHHGLTIKPSKCRFGAETINYLGFVVSHGRLLPQASKVSAIASMTPPATKKLLRSFLGMISFYKTFIPQASELTGPLSDLLKKPIREPLRWTQDLLSRFQFLKQALTSEPILRLPVPSLPFVLRTDASSHGLGAVLLQYHEDCPHPVSYASRKLQDRERRYSTIERECLAIVFGIHKFDFYLRGKEFILEVDHKPLIYLEKFKGKNDRVLRWALGLQPYKFRIVHVAGSDNIGADLLSRLSNTQ